MPTLPAIDRHHGSNGFEIGEQRITLGAADLPGELATDALGGLSDCRR
jgi:hypothetical protein